MLFDSLSDLLPNREDADECLSRAQKCERMARKARTSQNRSMLLKLAAHWREMAKKAKCQSHV
jgi:hypothetical protein